MLFSLGKNQLIRNFDIEIICRSWIAVTGNRNEFYQSMFQRRFRIEFQENLYLDCASIRITGSGTSTLDDLPDMFVDDMTLNGQIGVGECRSTSGYTIEYPFPGPSTTFTTFDNIAFKKPTNGNCLTKTSNVHR